MEGFHIAMGLTSFREIRETHCYYVDKTSFLTEFLTECPNKVTLITRPRRFGKTLTMDTLKEFIDIRNDPLRKDVFNGKNDALQGYFPANESRDKLDLENGASQSEFERNEPDLFDALEIRKHPDICAKWMYKCPTVFLSLKDMCVDSFSMALWSCPC